MAKQQKKGRAKRQQSFQKQYRQKARDKQTAAAPAVTFVQAIREPALQQASTEMPPPIVGAQTLQQERARFALERVKAALESRVDGKEFKSYAASFPAMIQMNGLGQAAAFYFSQGDTYQRLYDILSDWLKKEKQPYEGRDLLAGITELDMHHYRIAQAEALLLLDWVKRFAKAFVREG